MDRRQTVQYKEVFVGVTRLSACLAGWLAGCRAALACKIRGLFFFFFLSLSSGLKFLFSLLFEG